MIPDAAPRKKKSSVIQGLVLSHLSSMYPKKSPTIMDEGSKSANELTAASLLKLIRGGFFLSIRMPHFIIQKEKKGQVVIAVSPSNGIGLSR
jgi:hypothetical protein